MLRRFFVLAAIACSAASCSNSPTLPTSTGPTFSDIYFAGSMSPGETMFYSFTVSSTANTELTLVSLVPDQTAAPSLNVPMSIGLGTPSGTGCKLAASAVATPGLSPHLTMPTTPTIFCAQISDIGQLKVPVSFIVKIYHP